MAKYIAGLDIETGGIGPEFSVLSLGIVLCPVNDPSVIIDTLNVALKPNDGVYRVDPRAMGINKIDLKSHDLKAVSHSKGGEILHAFLRKYTKDTGDILPLGHGVSEDLGRLSEQVLSWKSMKQFLIPHHYIDTYRMAFGLRAMGLLPADAKIGLHELCIRFGIGFSQAHDAYYDALASVKLYKHLQSALRLI